MRSSFSSRNLRGVAAFAVPLCIGLAPRLILAQAPGPAVTVDTFMMSTGGSVRVPRGTYANPKDVVHHMPIELISGLMFISATVDGATGLFIVDTGNPILLLNTARVTPGAVVDSAFVSDAVGQNVPVFVHTVKQFVWGDVTLANVGAVGMNLAAVESQLSTVLGGRPILGMVGMGQLAQFIPAFDYKIKQILLYPLKTGTKESKVKLPPPSAKIPLTITSSGAFVPGTVGSKSLMLRLDSGDDGLGIDSDFAASLGSHVTSTGRSVPTFGVSGTVVSIPYVMVDRLMLGGMAYDSLEMRSHVMPKNPNDPNGHSEGGLGSPFFAKHRLAIDMQNKLLYIWADSAVQ